MKAYEHPGVIKGLFLSIDATMDHHFVMSEGMGNVSLSRGRLIAKSFQFSPSLLSDIKLVDVTERVFLAVARATKHDQAVVHLE